MNGFLHREEQGLKEFFRLWHVPVTVNNFRITNINTLREMAFMIISWLDCFLMEQRLYANTCWPIEFTPILGWQSEHKLFIMRLLYMKGQFFSTENDSKSIFGVVFLKKKY